MSSKRAALLSCRRRTPREGRVAAGVVHLSHLAKKEKGKAGVARWLFSSSCCAHQAVGGSSSKLPRLLLRSSVATSSHSIDGWLGGGGREVADRDKSLLKQLHAVIPCAVMAFPRAPQGGGGGARTWQPLVQNGTPTPARSTGVER